MASRSDDELEYLSPGFDPFTLVVPRLRAILVSHNISYPSSAKKAQLIEIFNQQLVPKSRKIIAARSKIRRTSRGITDMPSSQEETVNGDNEPTGSMPPPPVPDSTRRKKRSTRASTEESADDGPSTRRVSARAKSTTKHPRASDSETPEAELNQPLVRRSRKSEMTPTVKIEEPEAPEIRPSLPGSVFSHDNPFQSGSSPLGPGESRRKSAGTSTDRRKSSDRRRKTESPTKTDATQVKHDDGIVVPSSKTFDVSVRKIRASKIKDEREDTVEPGEEFTAEEQLELLRERAANGEVDILPPRRNRHPKRSSGISKSAAWVVVLSLLGGYATWWRKEKIEVGYCGIGKPVTALASLDMPEWASEWASVVEPQCEPCPQHAFCYADMEARCEADFVLKPHPLSLGGLVPLPPTCEPDSAKARKVKAVADKVVEELRDRRAKWECGDLVERDGKEATSVEVDVSTLKAEVSQKRRKGMSEAEFEALWEGALGEILGREEVTGNVDGNTHVYRVSSNSLARLPLSCAIRRSARLTLARYRVQLAGLILLVSAIAAIRNYFRTLQSDNARIPQLVSATLDRLATQAALYSHGNSPEPYISIGRMRDDVLRDEFSTQRRLAIWKRVEAVVGANANVRTVQKEDRAGDYSRVWEWIGSIQALEDSWSAGRRESGRYSLGPVERTGTPNGREPPGVEDETGALRKWDEGRPIY